jgi:hypothetical protein
MFMLDSRRTITRTLGALALAAALAAPSAAEVYGNKTYIKHK